MSFTERIFVPHSLCRGGTTFNAGYTTKKSLRYDTFLGFMWFPSTIEFNKTSGIKIHLVI